MFQIFSFSGQLILRIPSVEGSDQLATSINTMCLERRKKGKIRVNPCS